MTPIAFNINFWNTPAKRRAFLRKFVGNDWFDGTQKALITELRSQGFRMGSSQFRAIFRGKVTSISNANQIFSEPGQNPIPMGLFNQEHDDKFSRRFQYRLTLDVLNIDSGIIETQFHYISTDDQLSPNEIEEFYRDRIQFQVERDSPVVEGAIVGIEAKLR